MVAAAMKTTRTPTAAAPMPEYWPSIVYVLSQHLISGGVDLSDETECFDFLYSMKICDWRLIHKYLEVAIYEARQQQIAATISAAE